MNYISECIVLKGFNHGDADRIYTLLSKNMGKISALGKGVRKISSKRAGNLDTLSHVKVGFSEGPSGRKIITEVKLLNSFKKIKSSLEAVKHAYYVVELVHKFVEEDHENPELYGLVENTLNLFGKGDIKLNYLVNSFEIKLMKLLGYEMNLDKCFVCGRKYSDDWGLVKFNLETGGLYCDNCGSHGIIIDPKVAEVLRLLSKNRFRRSFSIKEIDIADKLIKSYVANILGKEVNTRRIFDL